MKKRVVLLGHGVGLKRIIDTLIENKTLNSEVVAVVTHPFEGHKRDLEMIESRKDIYGDCAYNVFNVASDYKLPLREADNVNDPEHVEWIDSYKPHYIISIGCRNILRKKFLDHFSGKVFNIHTTPLPKYRGAASDSWMILNGEWGKELYGCFHVIDTGIDTGDIVAKEKYILPSRCYPIDVFKVRMSIFPALLSKSLEILNSGNRDFEEQQIEEATTFPRLHTPTHGKIDFQRYDGKEIERFIYAFSYPFEGAHRFMEELKINIVEAEFHSSDSYHPLTYGTVIGKSESGDYMVSVKGGVLFVKKVEIKGEAIPLSKVFRLGKKLD